VRNHTDLLEEFASFPKVKLADYPSPLDALPRLSREAGVSIWIKRDDLIGPAPGGNKCRKLEYLLGEALAGDAQSVTTFGGMQSNHARMTAAASCRFGLTTHIFCFEPRPAGLVGNMQLNEIYGARLHFIPLGGGGRMRLETANRVVRWVSRLLAGSSYFIPVGGHSWKGCLGYAAAALEIDEQARSLGMGDASLVLAAGTGGTLAGLMAGLALCRSNLQLVGIDVGKLWKAFPESIASLASEICSRLGEPKAFKSVQVPLIESTYAGERYGLPSPEGNQALQRLARIEGILLDPVYTAKAFAGLLDLVSKGEIGRSRPVIFLHTGGLPGIFAFGGNLLRVQ
jgi:D-cysteine desulfhydrase family pyridoxal phosphate-dependent enzyme